MDPVETAAYRLDDLYVTECMLRSWFAGGTGAPDVSEDDVHDRGAVVAPSDAPARIILVVVVASFRLAS